MKVLFDIVHPADVLFFYHPIKQLKSQGHQVYIASREKDVTCDLLDAFELEHHCISTASTGVFGMAIELIKRDWALLKWVKKVKPDVMLGFGGVSISHVGKILGIPSLSFYDTEKANLQHIVTLPFITQMFVPESYDGKIAKGRTERFPGLKDFSYLHPDNFVADKTIATDAGYDETQKNYFIRLVNWNANHDIGLNGWDTQNLEAFVKALSVNGKVHISSESTLPDSLSSYQYQGATHHIHHLLAFCDVYIGESATMAGESVLLGVPAIYAADDQRGYTDDLANQGLLWKVLDVNCDNVLTAVNDVSALDVGVYQESLSLFMQNKINLSDYILDKIYVYQD